MADTKEKASIDTIFDDKHLTGIGKKFDNYLKWEKTTELDAIGNELADIWEKEFYQKASKKIEDVLGGLDKKINAEKHEDKLKGEFADIMLGYLEKAHSHDKVNKFDKVRFHELKEVMKNQGLKGKSAYDVVSQFYHNHIGYIDQHHRDQVNSIDTILHTALTKGLEGEKIKSLLRQSKDGHMTLAASKHQQHKWREIVGDIDDTEARMYMRNKVLPQYKAKIDNHQIFNSLSSKSAYHMFKGFKGEAAYDFKEKGGVKYEPLEKPKDKK